MYCYRFYQSQQRKCDVSLDIQLVGGMFALLEQPSLIRYVLD
jgi:hypothetical protein